MNILSDRFSEIKKASEPLYRTPKSVQETVEILKISEGGIFEVQRADSQRHTDSVTLIMQQELKTSRKASFRNTANALTHLTAPSR